MERGHLHTFPRCGMVGPKKTQQFFYPTPSNMIKFDLQALNQFSIDHLGLTVALRIGYRGKGLLYIELMAPFSKFSSLELSSIIKNYLASNCILTHNAFPKESQHGFF